MRINKASLVAALVLGGLLVGSTCALAQADGEKKGGGGKRGFPTAEERLARIDEAVKLTDEQKPKVKAVLEDSAKAMRDVPQDQRREKMGEIMAEQDKKLKDILTPEQYEKYKAMPRGGRGGKKEGGEKKE